METEESATAAAGPGRPAPKTIRWPIWVKETTKHALEQAAGSGYRGASQVAARLLDKIVETLPLKEQQASVALGLGAQESTEEGPG